MWHCLICNTGATNLLYIYILYISSLYTTIYMSNWHTLYVQWLLRVSVTNPPLQLARGDQQDNRRRVVVGWKPFWNSAARRAAVVCTHVFCHITFEWVWSLQPRLIEVFASTGMTNTILLYIYSHNIRLLARFNCKCTLKGNSCYNIRREGEKYIILNAILA